MTTASGFEDPWRDPPERGRAVLSQPLGHSGESVDSFTSSSQLSEDGFLRRDAGGSGSRRPSMRLDSSLHASEDNGSGFEDPEDDRVIYEDFTTIDWMKDLMRDHRRQNRVRSQHRPGWDWKLYSLFEATQSWILLSIIGISIGLLAGWIDVVAAYLGDIRFGHCNREWHISRSICCTGQYNSDGSCDNWHDWSYTLLGIRGFAFLNWIVYIIFSILFASACAFLVIRLAPYAAGSGSAEVKTILGGFIIKGFLGAWTLVVKSVGLPLMVASGLAVGKEGPMIHLACCVAHFYPRLFSKYWHNEGRKREILSAASGAGIAVAFGAPIGGVLFSLEELSSFFPSKTMVRSFFCALVATVTLQLVDPYRGKRVLYQVSYSRPWHFFEIIFFVILGVFGGLCGVLLIRGNQLVQRYRKYSWLKDIPLQEVAVLAGVTAVFSYLNNFTRVDSSDLLEALFRECEEADFHGLCNQAQRGWTVFALLVALLMRTALTIVTFGAKVPAGIFIPSMVCGGLFGRILGIVVQTWQEGSPDNPLFKYCHPDTPCVTPGMYALLGAVAALGGVTRMTLSLTVVMFELTGTLNYIVPGMVTLLTAKVVGDLFGKGGIAEMQIRINKYPFLDPREDRIIGLSASEVMTPAEELVCFVGKGMKVEDIDRALDQVGYKGFPVVHDLEDPTLIGYISREDLKYALDKSKTLHNLPPSAPVFFDTNEGTRSNASRPWHTRQPSDYDGTDARDRPTTLLRGMSGRSFELGGSGNGQWLQLAAFMDKTPLYVHPKVAIEVVADMFKKLGPRYILVMHLGRLRGIITKKDILIAMYGEDEASFSTSPPGGPGNNLSIPDTVMGLFSGMGNSSRSHSRASSTGDMSGRTTPRRGGVNSEALLTRARRLRGPSSNLSQEWGIGGAAGPGTTGGVGGVPAANHSNPPPAELVPLVNIGPTVITRLDHSPS
ncbi:chloride channel [Phlyctochytrium arcticum]|nr:chloride channel [Phlyctochytrium arcticum]